MNSPRLHIKERALWLDFTRVLAAFIIIYDHLNSSYFAANTYETVQSHIKYIFGAGDASIPFFYIVGGYFTKMSINASKLSRKILSLTLVFTLWNLIYAVGLNDEINFSRIFGIGRSDGICADYALWFVRDIIIILCLCGIIKKSLLISSVIAMVFYLWGNQWHSEFLQHIPFPKPSAFLLYFLGLSLSYFDLALIHKKLIKYLPLYVLLTPLFIIGKHQGYFELIPELQILLSIYRALLLIYISQFVQLAAPHSFNYLAAQSKSCFLSYAIHAGAILGGSMLLLRYYPPLLESKFFVLSLPFIIFIFCGIFYRFMKVKIPFLLPLLAHEGKLTLPACLKAREKKREKPEK